MTTRLNIQFNDRQKKSLDELASELGTTKAGVLKAALSLLEVAVREKREGNRIGVVKDNTVVKEIIGLE
jgi:predicted transcriptional regulator